MAIDTTRSKGNKTGIFLTRLSRVPFILALFAILCFLYEFGFDHKKEELDFIWKIYLLTIITGSISLIIKWILKKFRPRLKSLPFDLILLIFLLLVVYQNVKSGLGNKEGILTYPLWIYTATFLVFFREFSAIRIEFRRGVFNPAQLFVISFLLIIIAGTFLLLLPNATVTSISLTDALFTSTSAVCVTGLTVVDTGSYFTEFGQIIIVLLIQMGGLGIMTFTSYFSYFFRGGSSFESQLILRDLTNSEKISEVFTILKRILLITLFIEGIGSVLILQTINTELIPSFSDRIFFSVFHSISGFCNAGFSTLPHSFYEDAFQFNYSLHLVVAALFILGGLGFPIAFNLLKYIKSRVQLLFRKLIKGKKRTYSPWLINVNTRIVLITSMVLLVGGTIVFLALEYNNTLSPHNFFGKIVTAFFGAATTRTAGFNTVDTAALHIPTILVMIFLMWVGASPASTGGGIKTSTLAVAVLNILSIAKGNRRLHIYKREIPEISVNRSFAIIFLSLVVIFLSTGCIVVSDPDKEIIDICFETVSAFSTVGLSRGITAELTSAGKLILVMTMFIGRISMLTLLIAFFKKVATGTYRYPTESILIN